MAEDRDPVVGQLGQVLVAFRRKKNRDGDVPLQQRGPIRLDVLQEGVQLA